jgi:hypothetical protein
MSPVAAFVLQFLWFLLAWSVIATLLVAPAIARLAHDDALAVVMTPQLFRVLGVGLLVPNLAPEMPLAFAVPTAVGDATTAVLALLAVVALRRRWPSAHAIAWACNLVGVADLAIAVPHAARVQAARFLFAQWYVPALGLPLMIVSHTLALRMLARGRRASARDADA